MGWTCCVRKRQEKEKEEEEEEIIEAKWVRHRTEVPMVGGSIPNEVKKQTPCEIISGDQSNHPATSETAYQETMSRHDVKATSCQGDGLKPSGIPMQNVSSLEYSMTAPKPSPSMTSAEEAAGLSHDVSSRCSMMQLHAGMTWSMVTPAKQLCMRINPFVVGAIKGVTWIGPDELGETWIAPHNFNDGSFGLLRRVLYNNHPAVMKIQDNSSITRQEVNMLRRAFPHPNILMLFAHVRSCRTLVMISAMARCDLTRLVDYLDGLDRTLVPFIIACIYCALRHLHRSFIAHRDVKDPNIVFLDDGTPQLADFGCASKFDCKNQRCPVTECMIGTFGYLSPEVARGVSTGPGQDFWGMGIILCACLNGNIPQDYVDKRLAMRPLGWNRSYNAVCLRSFRKLDLELIYNLLPEEHRVLRACFTEDPIVRIAEVETVMRSDYFSKFNLESIDSGYRHPQCHEELKVLVDQCCAAGENTEARAHELAIPEVMKNAHYMLYSRHLVSRLFKTCAEAPLTDV